MVEYLCFRCGYNGKQKINLIRHLNRKNMCKPTEDDVEIEAIKNYYGFNDDQKNLQNETPKNPKMTQKDPKKPQNDPISDLCEDPKKPQKTPFCAEKNPKKPQKTPNEPICIYCSRTYSKMCHLRRHEKTCKKKIEINQTDKIIKMEKQIEELQNFKIQTQNNTTNNTTNNNCNNNITNNNTININNYGNENLKHLRGRDFAKLLDGIYSAVPKLIEKIHFDPKHPENQNIKYTNHKSPYLKIMKDDKWQLVNKKHELLDLIDNKCFMLKEKYYAILEKKKYNITEAHRDKIEAFINKYHEEDKKMMLDLIERTELMLLNNS